MRVRMRRVAGVGDLERADAVGARDDVGGLAVQAAHECVELEPIGVGVALEEEGQGGVGRGSPPAVARSTEVDLRLPAASMPRAPQTSMRWS